MSFNHSVRDQIFLYIKAHPGVCRTEVRDALKLQNNVSGPAIKELIDKNMLVEGPDKVSMTTGKPGKSLYVEEEWANQLEAQNRIFE